MQHRQPRLGDIVDDYCPRERRLTNHAVVAMVGPDIKQTRCTTCDTEHEYKHAKVPVTRKKKDAPAALFKQVLTSAQPEAIRAADQVQDEPNAEAPAPVSEPEVHDEQPMAAAAPDEVGDDIAEPGDGDDGPVHRRLIRATLPRPEGGQVQPRPLPQFTVRQAGKFGKENARGGRPGGGGGGSASRPRNASSRGSFGRNGTRDTFSARSSSGAPHGGQRGRPTRQGGGRPMRQGKKSK